MKRPDTFHTFTYAKAGQPLRGDSDSLSEYGTIAFSIERMRELIKPDPARPGTLCASEWFDLVPDAYKEDVLGAVQRAVDAFGRQPATEENVQHFIEALHLEILASVRRRDPA